MRIRRYIGDSRLFCGKERYGTARAGGVCRGSVSGYYLARLGQRLKVSQAVADQLRQNYQVQKAKGLTGLKGNEPHKRLRGRAS
jgi:hypothetical protein